VDTHIFFAAALMKFEETPLARRIWRCVAAEDEQKTGNSNNRNFSCDDMNGNTYVGKAWTRQLKASFDQK
jgi:cell wall assembly regulator SMI1